MKRHRTMIATVLAILATTTTAHAMSKPAMFYNGKFWKTFGYARNSADIPMCVMHSAGGASNFYVKWTPTAGMAMEFWKASWRLPEGTEVPWSVDFVDDGTKAVSTITAKAGWTKANTHGIGTSVFMSVVAEDQREFLRLFGEADKVVIRFPEGDEPVWQVNMEGSRKAAVEFTACIQMVQQVISKQSTSPVKPTSPVGKSAAPAKKKDDGSI